MNSQDLSESFKKDQSYYIYDSSMDETLSERCQRKSQDDVLFHASKRHFTKSDLFVVNAIANLSLVSIDMVVDYLMHYSLKFPDKPVPNSREGVEGSLKRLTECGLVVKKIFTTDDIKFNLSYHGLTSHGYYYAKKVLNFHKQYDSMLFTLPMDIIVKYLGTNIVTTKALAHPNAVGATAFEKFYDSELGKQDLFGEIVLSEEEEKTYILVEPINSKYDKGRLSAQEYESELITRIKVIKKYLTSKVGNASTGRVILVADDYHGLIKACNIVKESLKDFAPMIYITTQGTAFKHGVENCIRVKENGQVEQSNPLE